MGFASIIKRIDNKYYIPAPQRVREKAAQMSPDFAQFFLILDKI